MHELKAILAAFESAPRGKPAALATVVRVQGSSYRKPGARMLVLPDGRRVGTVSGGCLEGDVARKAWWRTESGQAAVVRYDSTSDEEAVWEFGLGCKGVVDVLLEQIDPATPPGYWEFLHRAMADQTWAVVARVIGGGELGAWLAIDEVGRCETDLDDEDLIGQVRAEAARVLMDQRSSHSTFESFEGPCDLFLELLSPPIHLVICGGGHDAVPLAAMARSLGWRVTVYDGRARFADASRFPGADAVLAAPPAAISSHVKPGPRSGIVVMSHNVADDFHYLRAAFASEAEYIGLLGPRHRTGKLLAELREKGCGLATADAARLHAPVGLDIGAESPSEIALAIVAEVQACFADRPGGLLRNRRQPIHDLPTGAIMATDRVFPRLSLACSTAGSR